MALTSIEICAGAGGQALGLEQAGFDHVAVVEIDHHACNTLRENRPAWNVIEGDVVPWIKEHAHDFAGVDLVAGGVPCPPFSYAGKQLGPDDERDLFPAMIELVRIVRPRAIMIENVRGLLDPKFEKYRAGVEEHLREIGYCLQWKLLQASDFGVPQLRPRVIAVGFREDIEASFEYPEPLSEAPPTVGEALSDLMAARGWTGAAQWAKRANRIAPTLVGGSKKHGGPDLGPTRARRAWAELGVNGSTIAPEAPDPDFQGDPRLTVRMAARIQGFPDDWAITGAKTNAYRQVGNAFPPPVARAVASQSPLLSGQTVVGRRLSHEHQSPRRASVLPPSSTVNVCVTSPIYPSTWRSNDAPLARTVVPRRSRARAPLTAHFNSHVERRGNYHAARLDLAGHVGQAQLQVRRQHRRVGTKSGEDHAAGH